MEKILKFNKRRAFNKDEGLEQKSKNNKRRAKHLLARGEILTKILLIFWEI